MIKIGEFSKVCGISIKALRHYDEIHLIKPLYTDANTGYRFYEYQQLSEMLLIKRLKYYGFSLDEIKGIIKEQDTKAIVPLLREQQNKIEQSMEDQHKVLNLLQAHIQNVERTGEMMSYKKDYQVAVKEVSEMRLLSVRQMMGVKDFDHAFGQLFGMAEKIGATITGVPLSIYHDVEFNPNLSDIEVAIPILEKELANHILPAGRAIMSVHTGTYDDISEAYVACVKYMEEQGLEILASPFEIYRISGKDHIPIEQWETDIYFQIK